MAAIEHTETSSRECLATGFTAEPTHLSAIVFSVKNRANARLWTDSGGGSSYRPPYEIDTYHL